MSRIKGRDTKLELRVRKYLYRQGLRYRIHYNIAGNPDIALPGEKIAIFVHGCFWHPHESCKISAIPKTNTKFWVQKLAQNKKRDHAVRNILMSNGWKVFTVRECTLRNNGDKRLRTLYREIEKSI